MKTFKIYLTAFAFAAAVFTSLALVEDSKGKVYDYVSIVNTDYGEVIISDNQKPVEIIKHKDAKFEFMDIFTVIQKYERDGYDLFNNNLTFHGGGGTSYNYFLLRREHKN